MQNIAEDKAMADAFISYSQKDRALAEALAQRLRAQGLSVWWDTDLVGGVEFRSEIERQLGDAKAVLVIWSPNSVSSRFVVDEADTAAATGKLISVLVEDLSPSKLPMGFRSIQSVPMDDDEQLFRALARMGLDIIRRASERDGSKQTARVAIDDEAAREEEAWKFVLARQDLRLADEFNRRFPNSKYRLEASKRATLLADRDRLRSKLAIGLGSIFVVGVPGILMFLEWAGPAFGENRKYYDPAHQVPFMIFMVLVIVCAIWIVRTAWKIRRLDDVTHSQLEAQEREYDKL